MTIHIHSQPEDGAHARVPSAVTRLLNELHTQTGPLDLDWLLERVHALTSQELEAFQGMIVDLGAYDYRLTPQGLERCAALIKDPRNVETQFTAGLVVSIEATHQEGAAALLDSVAQQLPIVRQFLDSTDPHLQCLGLELAGALGARAGALSESIIARFWLDDRLEVRTACMRSVARIGCPLPLVEEHFARGIHSLHELCSGSRVPATHRAAPAAASPGGARPVSAVAVQDLVYAVTALASRDSNRAEECIRAMALSNQSSMELLVAEAASAIRMGYSGQRLMQLLLSDRIPSHPEGKTIQELDPTIVALRALESSRSTWVRSQLIRFANYLQGSVTDGLNFGPGTEQYTRNAFLLGRVLDQLGPDTTEQLRQTWKARMT